MIANSHLYQEIHEQPAVVGRFLQQSDKIVRQLAAAIKQQNITHVVIAARGTSDNAGRYAQYLFGAYNRLTVALATPSLFTLYNQPPKFGNALVLGISQSGKSPDIVAVLAEARCQGNLTAAITNETESPLAAEADFVIDLCAGDEFAVAATKTYTAELAAIALLSCHMAKDNGRLDRLKGLPDAMSATLSLAGPVSLAAPRYRYMEHCVVIGRGFNYATAFEIALKMKELTYTIVEPYSSADFLHGPLALIQNGFPVIVVAPSGKLTQDFRDFTKQLNERGAETIIISDDAETLGLARIPFKLPFVLPEWLSPFTAIIPGQLLALYLADARDLDVDTPRNIRKVTETT
ncbi:MAG: glucosamine--fructose-6-phosphate aminotransferase (isomerizing) [Cellvibrionaceae bacterium]|jgi:glucosamine--fructose-6-phosphate aminotransferase (isomerizing)